MKTSLYKEATREKATVVINKMSKGLDQMVAEKSEEGRQIMDLQGGQDRICEMIKVGVTRRRHCQGQCTDFPTRYRLVMPLTEIKNKKLSGSC